MIITLSQRDVSFGMFYGSNDISDKMITSFVSVAKNTDDIDQKIKDHQLGRSSFFYRLYHRYSASLSMHSMQILLGRNRHIYKI